MKRKKRHWYHLTADDHGPRLQVKKKRPLHPGPDEPPTPRLCVAPSPILAFTAGLFPTLEKVHVYRTPEPRKAYFPGESVWDSCVTCEHWIWQPAELVKVGWIPSELVRMSAAPAYRYLLAKGSANLRLRVFQVFEAYRHLGKMWPCNRSRLLVSSEDFQPWITEISETIETITSLRMKGKAKWVK